jgi:hypothetical protein
LKNEALAQKLLGIIGSGCAPSNSTLARHCLTCLENVQLSLKLTKPFLYLTYSA